jgi:hypothetical protein
MKTHSKCIPAAIAVVVASLMTAQLEPALARSNGDEAPQSVEPVAEKQTPVVLPNRPLIVPKTAAVMATSRSQIPAPTGQTIRQPDAPAPQESKSKKKWIVIVAAAGAAGAAAALLLRGGGNEKPPVQTPTLVVGVPSVGQPQ